MKADLTRDTFHPLKHFARVLTQQGRVQLDADMNEQAAILLRLLAHPGGRSDRSRGRSPRLPLGTLGIRHYCADRGLPQPP